MKVRRTKELESVSFVGDEYCDDLPLLLQQIAIFLRTHDINSPWNISITYSFNEHLDQMWEAELILHKDESALLDKT